MTAAWSGIAAPTANDWIGLYIPGAAHASYIAWIYVSCSQAPGAAAASGTCSFVVPGTVAAGTTSYAFSPTAVPVSIRCLPRVLPSWSLGRAGGCTDSALKIFPFKRRVSSRCRGASPPGAMRGTGAGSMDVRSGARAKVPEAPLYSETMTQSTPWQTPTPAARG